MGVGAKRGQEVLFDIRQLKKGNILIGRQWIINAVAQLDTIQPVGLSSIRSLSTMGMGGHGLRFEGVVLPFLEEETQNVWVSTTVPWPWRPVRNLHEGRLRSCTYVPNGGQDLSFP